MLGDTMHYSTSGHAAASECVLQRMLTKCSTSCLYAFAAVMRGAAFDGAAYISAMPRPGPWQSSGLLAAHPPMVSCLPGTPLLAGVSRPTISSSRHGAALAAFSQQAPVNFSLFRLLTAFHGCAEAGMGGVPITHLGPIISAPPQQRHASSHAHRGARSHLQRQFCLEKKDCS